MCAMLSAVAPTELEIGKKKVVRYLEAYIVGRFSNWVQGPGGVQDLHYQPRPSRTSHSEPHRNAKHSLGS